MYMYYYIVGKVCPFNSESAYLDAKVLRLSIESRSIKLYCGIF